MNGWIKADHVKPSPEEAVDVWQVIYHKYTGDKRGRRICNVYWSPELGGWVKPQGPVDEVELGFNDIPFVYGVTHFMIIPNPED